MNLEDLDILEGVLEQFACMCRYPHPSGGEGPLADYVENLLRARGLSPLRDEWNNLMAEVPATPGREGAPLVVLQGHLDMVCAVKEGSGYCPAVSPVVCLIEDGVLRSDGNSSLGADNNLGNAAVLWLTGQDCPHGPLRLLFTTAEEVGLQGAKRVDPAWLDKARYLINTDGFVLGEAVVSCAGGYREKISRAVERISRKKTVGYRLALTGFPGGHSGYDIHRGRTNPIRLAAEFLSEPGEYELVSLTGGHAENAIPMDCTALLTVDEENAEKLERKTEDFFSGAWDGTVTLTREGVLPEEAYSTSFRDGLLALLQGVQTGIYSWRDRARGQVSASANLGAVREQDGQLTVSCFIRAARNEDEGVLASQHAGMARKHGYSVVTDSYPGWPERSDSPLANTMKQVWMDLTGQEMKISSVHVGLEPAVLGGKNPNMLMVSTGPDILDPHSLEERAPLGGLADYVRLLTGTLDRLSR